MPGLKKPLRENVALAIDGGGIKGAMVARALMSLEDALGGKLSNVVRLTAGTSTGAIIAAGVARGLSARAMRELYTRLGPEIFRKTWRNLPLIRYLVRYQYSSRPLEESLAEHLGDVTIGELYRARPDFHMVLTATDIYANRTRFIKLYKSRYADWRLRDAVMASSIVPTVFPVFPHRYSSATMPPDTNERWIPEPRYWVDGGVGSYSNPCYLAAYEIAFCLGGHGWRLDNTTLISIGTGMSQPSQTWEKRLNSFRRTPASLHAPEWIFPSIDAFVHDANLQQVRLTQHFFVDAIKAQTHNPDAALDFRRFNVAFDEPIEMDDADMLPKLEEYGERLGQMILDDVREPIGAYSCGAPAYAFDLHLRGPGGAIVI